MPRRSVLMIPGPSEPEPEVLSVLASPVMPHYGLEWSEIYNSTCESLKNIFGTKQSVILLPCPGAAAVELAVVNLLEPGDKALNCVNGFFGGIFRDCIDTYHGKRFDVEADVGRAIDPEKVREVLSEEKNVKLVCIVHNETSTGVANPVGEIGELCREFGAFYAVDSISSFGGMEIRMDDWNIDVCVGYSSKAMSSVNGIVPLAISERVWKYVKERKSPITSRILNLRVWRKSIDEWGSWGHPFPTSMPCNVIVALKRAVDIVLEEGLDKRYRRHYESGKAMRAGLRALGLEPLANEEAASNTVTAVRVPEPVDVKKLKQILTDDFNIMVAETGAFTGVKGLRIGHMGVTASPSYVISALAALEASLLKLGLPVQRGAAVTAGLDTFEKQ